MRYFIALEIPEESKHELKAVQREIEQIIPQVRITNSEKLHLTIAFIGEQPEKLKDRIVQVIAQATSEIPPFSITPAYIDGFPHLHTAHTFWVGVKGDIDKLVIIEERIKDGLIGLGLDPDDRRYVPHIAIGKISGDFQLQPEQEAKLQEMMVRNSFEPIHISSIKLFESIPEEGFHRHNTLAEVALSPESSIGVSSA